MSSIILCGLPGSGKTSVGKILAGQLKCSLHDIDWLIEARDGQQRSCREIVQKMGEGYFRQLEQEVVATLTSHPASVIATGGSTPLFPQHMRYLQSLGTMIYLQANPAELYPRILRGGIPTYLDPDHPAASFQRLAAARHPVYLQACQRIIETDGLTPEEISDEIAATVKWTKWTKVR